MRPVLILLLAQLAYIDPFQVTRKLRKQLRIRHIGRQGANYVCCG